MILLASLLMLLMLIGIIAYYNREYIEDFERIDPTIFQPEMGAMRDEELRDIICNGDASQEIRQRAAEILEIRKSYNV
jgi:hypothetical protein